MVSFGSTLRLSRRCGWEGGYLDYETLKLLLSQIEAVYEEEQHRRSQERDLGHGLIFDVPEEEPLSKRSHKCGAMVDCLEEIIIIIAIVAWIIVISCFSSPIQTKLFAR